MGAYTVMGTHCGTCMLLSSRVTCFFLCFLQVFGHASVEFNSVFVIVNLQTWVVLFDYLGIGIPTPPPSRPGTPTDDDDDGHERVAASLQAASDALRFQVDGEEHQLWAVPSTPGVNFVRAGRSSEEIRTSLSPGGLIDKSFQEDARDFCSLGSDDGTRYGSKTTGGKAFEQPPCKGGSLEETAAKESGDSVRTAEEGGEDSSVKASVWGVEGKIGLDVKLHVRALTVTFNKPEHPLARGSVSALQARVGVSKGNVRLTGSLGQASVVDLTETGCYYRER